MHLSIVWNHASIYRVPRQGVMVPQQLFGYKFYKNLFFPYNCLLHSAVKYIFGQVCLSIYMN